MANDKQEGGKAPAKVETTHLKVFIHCEGCKKKVKKVLRGIEGVHSVEVDGVLGKVTVTGTVDSKVLLKKLEKSGKFSEVWPTGVGGGKGKDQQQQKGEKKEGKEEKAEGGGGGGKKGQGESKGDNASTSAKSNNTGGDGDNDNNKGNGNGEGSKKKKGGGGGGGGGGGPSDETGPSKNTANKSLAPVMVETGYSMESAEFATHMFSDENANNCNIM